MKVHYLKRIRLFAFGFVLLALPACSDIQFEGKIFDAVGINDMMGTQKKNNTKLAERSSLILPPDKSLPAPGSAPVNTGAIAAHNQQWPDDPDQRRKAEAEAKRIAMEKKCKELQWKDRRDTTFIMPKECRSGLSKMLNNAVQ